MKIIQLKNTYSCLKTILTCLMTFNELTNFTITKFVSYQFCLLKKHCHLIHLLVEILLLTVTIHSFICWLTQWQRPLWKCR